MFKLLVSYDCGVIYKEDQVVDDVSLLDERCKELDGRRLRWVVEDETGNPVRVCRIHAGILAAFGDGPEGRS